MNINIIQKNTQILLVVFATAILAGCGHSGFEKTKTGLLYDIHSDGKGALLKHKDWIKVHLKMVLGDSVLQDTYAHMPLYGNVDTAVVTQHNFTDILTKLRVGDSAIVIMNIDTLRKMNRIPPEMKIKPGTSLKGYLKILAVLKSENDVTADIKLEEGKELAKEIVEIEKYLKEKNIVAAKTPKGSFVQITQAGDGMKADSGKTLKVFYTGKTFEGTFFDGNMDTTRNKGRQPLSMVLGTGQVIVGWDEGLSYFKKGSKGKLFIPAMLAYKGQAQSEVLKAYTNLAFDIEMADVLDTPAQPTLPTPDPRNPPNK